MTDTQSSARNVAVTHTDTVLPETDNRSIWAKRSLARWGHGLSYPEPAPPEVEGELIDKPAVPDECTPLNNLLLS